MRNITGDDIRKQFPGSTFYVVEQESTREIERRGFDVRDGKGREIGASVVTWTEVRREITADEQAERSNNGFAIIIGAAGTFYVLRPHALRAGKSFGAIQRDQYFATEAARDAAVAKYFAGAAKRAAKLEGK